MAKFESISYRKGEERSKLGPVYLTKNTSRSGWKLARVIPIFKSGPKRDGNNYRPISVILVFFWDVEVEKIVHDQLIQYLISLVKYLHQINLLFENCILL